LVNGTNSSPAARSSREAPVPWLTDVLLLRTGHSRQAHQGDVPPPSNDRRNAVLCRWEAVVSGIGAVAVLNRCTALDSSRCASRGRQVLDLLCRLLSDLSAKRYLLRLHRPIWPDATDATDQPCCRVCGDPMLGGHRVLHGPAPPCSRSLRRSRTTARWTRPGVSHRTTGRVRSRRPHPAHTRRSALPDWTPSPGSAPRPPA
jgi:hypothetical protein